MITVYGMKQSGNCYKLQLLLTQLQQDFRWEEIDIFRGGTRTDAFLAKNPNGKVPTVEFSDGRILAESNAILFYLAKESNLLPENDWQQAQVLQWLFFEQYSHEPYIAVARFVKKFLAADHPRQAELPKLIERGNQALAVMEKHLSGHEFFVDDHYSIADIALYAYTHTAADGGFDLNMFPAVNRWLQKVAQQPRYVELGS